MLLVAVAMSLVAAPAAAQGLSAAGSEVVCAIAQAALAQQGRAPAKKPSTKKPRVTAPPPAGVVKREAPPPPPTGPIFDRDANALRDITAALTRARDDNRRVLIHWGSNSCETCQRLHAAMNNDRAIKRMLLYEYELVLVDVGSRDRNLDIALSYGVAPQASGVPWLTMLNFDGEPIANLHAGTFGDGRGSFDVKKIEEFLRTYQVRYPSADAVLNRALGEARLHEKPLLVQFIAPTCERCREVETWFTRSDVASVLERNFARVRIDIDRTIGGRDLLRRYSGDWQSAPPWFALVDSKSGGLIATSVDAKIGNIAGLRNDAAIARFCDMLKANATLLTPEELAWLAKSLQELNAPPKPVVAENPVKSPGVTPSAPPRQATAPTGD